MGAGTSKQENIVEAKEVNSSVFSYLSKTTNVQSTDINLQQEMVVTGIKAYCKDLEIGQTIKGTIKTLQQFDEQSTMDLISNVTAEIDQKMQQGLSKSIGIGGSSGKTTQYNAAKNEIMNEIKTEITSETINKQINKVVAGQNLLIENIVLDPCGTQVYKELGYLPTKDVMKCLETATCGKFDQNIVINFVAESIGSKIANIINKNEAAAKIKTEIAQDMKIKAEGLTALAGISGCGCVICVVVLLAVIAKVALSPAGQKAIEQGSSGPRGALMK